VLDVASGAGSFSCWRLRCSVVAVDEDVDAFSNADALPAGPFWRVIGKSEGLPFAAGSFDLIVCNHALEHLEDLGGALDEMRRVLKPDGRMYVSVPYGYGVCDGIYRWLFEGGGHVNRFRRDDVIRVVESRTGLKLVRWQKLYSSFAYLYRILVMLKDPPPGLPPRIVRAGWLPPVVVKLAHRMLYVGTRLADRWFGTSSALYGWAFWFDRAAEAVVEEPSYPHVCMYCGSGHPVESLKRRSRWTYSCPRCNGTNLIIGA
jgi:SAM-dependent methyltransferase